MATNRTSDFTRLMNLMGKAGYRTLRAAQKVSNAQSELNGRQMELSDGTWYHKLASAQMDLMDEDDPVEAARKLEDMRWEIRNFKAFLTRQFNACKDMTLARHGPEAAGLC